MTRQPGDTRQLVAPDDARGERLDHTLARAYPDLSRSRIRTLIDAGHVRILNRPAKAAARLKGGEVITLVVPPPQPATVAPEDLPLSILFEDRDVLVINKCAGMVVHPAAGNWSGTLVNAVLHRVRDLTGVGDERRPGLVHRLDKDTSGCLVIAKNDAALGGLQKAFAARQVDKRYLALVHGSPPERGTVVTAIRRHPVHRKRFTGKLSSGKPAETRFVVRERFDGAALLEVELLTGRTHQVRVHLSEEGFPLLGDEVYGARRKPGNVRVMEAQEAIGRQALHAWRLAFSHPRTGKALSFEAPLPDDFERARAVLRGR